MKFHAPFFKISEKVQQALNEKAPVVALESTVISHGLPYPENLHVAQEMIHQIESQGATAAVIGLRNGKVHIGMNGQDIEDFSSPTPGRFIAKVSRGNLAATLVTQQDGATTVSATMMCAYLAGIKIFATGGIGGVHRGYDQTLDMSADLKEFVTSPVLVVCSGAKSILDIPKTLEVLETYGVPTAGYQTKSWPTFYSATSSHKNELTLNSPQEVARWTQLNWSLEGKGMILANPVPPDYSIPADQVESWIDHALKEAKIQNIQGKIVTPFLLSYLSQISNGKTLECNKALLVSNARLAAQIALEMV